MDGNGGQMHTKKKPVVNSDDPYFLIKISYRTPIYAYQLDMLKTGYSTPTT